MKLMKATNFKNILSVDVEDYFQVDNLRKVINPADWDSYQSRVVVNTDKILGIFAEEKVRATFFVLGWVAERFPELVTRIHQAGHEIASHGFGHRLVYEQGRSEFRNDIRRSKNILENIIKEPVSGYRAPTYSIIKDSIWALDVLIEEGFEYDSSFFPFRFSKQGLPEDKRYPHKIYNHSKFLWELPISTIKFLGRPWPFAGGGYFRLCPLTLVKSGIKNLNSQSYPAVVYLHPWEIDPDQPRFKVSPLSAFRHYYNLAGTENKLRKLIRNFEFTTVKDYLKSAELEEKSHV